MQRPLILRPQVVTWPTGFSRPGTLTKPLPSTDGTTGTELAEPLEALAEALLVVFRRPIDEFALRFLVKAPNAISNSEFLLKTFPEISRCKRLLDF